MYEGEGVLHAFCQIRNLSEVNNVIGTMCRLAFYNFLQVPDGKECEIACTGLIIITVCAAVGDLVINVQHL